MTNPLDNNQDRDAEWERIAQDEVFPRERELRSVWESIQVPPENRVDTASLWQRIDTATRPGLPGEGRPPHRRAQPKRRSPWGRFAIGVGMAGCFLLAGIVAQRYWDSGSTTQSVAQHEITTTIGERASFQLPDGSSVVLGPSSTLSYAADFGTTTRDVRLNGEALFTVVNHTAVPLQVHAGDAVTRVLGTTFAVRRYPGDTAVRVVVAQGKVSLNATILSTGDIGMLGAQGQAVVQRGTNVTSALAWTEGKLVLDKVPLRDVISEFKRWYGITLVVADSALLSQRIIATLDVEMPQEALEIIAYTLGATLQKQGSQATLLSPH